MFGSRAFRSIKSAGRGILPKKRKGYAVAANEMQKRIHQVHIALLGVTGTPYCFAMLGFGKV